MPKDDLAIISVPGLVFRRFRGPEDFVGMAAVINSAADADGVERSDTAEDLAVTYRHLYNCDLDRDFIIAEAAGKLVGYGRGYWEVEASSGSYIYGMVCFLAPEWRRRGIGTTMLRWLETRMREVAADHSAAKGRFFESICSHGEDGKAVLLEREGYRPVRFFNEMLRPSLEDISDFPLPAGLELRPVEAGQYRAIWDAWQEALMDHWGFTEPTEELYLRWLEDKKHFQPELWQVAWDISSGDVAGNVLTFIDREENGKYHRLRGYTEGIAVGRRWRRRGLARALIAKSLRAQKAAGMTESALGVDSESLTGATRVYEDCGFRVLRTHRLYRKDLGEG
jgi:mycothiol synthase